MLDGNIEITASGEPTPLAYQWINVDSGEVLIDFDSVKMILVIICRRLFTTVIDANGLCSTQEEFHRRPEIVLSVSSSCEVTEGCIRWYR